MIRSSRLRGALPHNRLVGLESEGQIPTQGIRLELVERVRAEIEAGTYKTAEKLALAVDRLFCDISV